MQDGTVTSISERKREYLLEASWLFSQYRYHEIKAAGVVRKNNLATNIAWVFLIAGAVLAGITMVIEIFRIDTPDILYSFEETSLMPSSFVGMGIITFDNTLKLAIAVVDLLFAFMMTYLTKIIYGGTLKSMATKSKMYRVAFRRCIDFRMDDEADSDTTYQKIRNLFKEIGIKSLEEVNSWALYHRTKNVKSFLEKYSEYDISL